MSTTLPAFAQQMARPLLTSTQAAEFLGVSEDTLRDMRAAGEIAYINIGRGRKRETPRYDVSDLIAWKDRSKRTACQSSSVKTTKRASTPTNFLGAVTDFREALAKLGKTRPENLKAGSSRRLKPS